MRCADARGWLLAALAACLVACTGPGLEPPSREGNDFSSGSPGGASGGAGGSRSSDAGAQVGAGEDDEPTPPVVVDPGVPGDAGDAGDAGDEGDPDLDAGTP